MQRKKPDLLIILSVILGVGIVTTSYAASLWDQHDTQKQPEALHYSITR